MISTRCQVVRCGTVAEGNGLCAAHRAKFRAMLTPQPATPQARNPPPLGWQTRGACAGKPQHLWFPGPNDNATVAKQICSTCPVRGECLADAIARHETHGIWGGMSNRERRVYAHQTTKARRA